MAAQPPLASPASTVAIVLAAGVGTRFAAHTHKLDSLIDGRPIITAAIEHARAAAIGPVVVVTAAHVATLRHHDPTGRDDVVVIYNDNWESGQMSSLRLGIATATERFEATQVVVGLGDQPFIEPSAWRAVAAAGTEAPIAVATYRGNSGSQRGHPVSLGEHVWPLLPAAGDQGARTLIDLRPDLVIEVPCQGSPADIDTLEDLDRWQNNSSTSSP
jgi:CTP:molybdopterin cytidylyltransferase MocA